MRDGRSSELLMKIIHEPCEFAPATEGVSLAIGMFDGVHLGHQRILAQMVKDAGQLGTISVAITFDRHPNAVVAPEQIPPLIYSLGQRLSVIGSLEVDIAWLIRFDREFSRQPGAEFIDALVKDFGRIRSVWVGADFSFGHKRSGNVALLKARGQHLGFSVHDVPAVSCDGEIISSTRIRGAIRTGDLESASQMLGRPYSVLGRVLRGDQLGRELGFPTANLDVSGLGLPPMGVYAGIVDFGGRKYQAVANLGQRPSLDRPVGDLRFEVHLMEFEGDLYGHEIEFAFVKRLRAEEKFASLDALKRQIEKDAAAARALLSERL